MLDSRHAHPCIEGVLKTTRLVLNRLFETCDLLFYMVVEILQHFLEPKAMLRQNAPSSARCSCGIFRRFRCRLAIRTGSYCRFVELGELIETASSPKKLILMFVSTSTGWLRTPYGL